MITIPEVELCAFATEAYHRTGRCKAPWIGDGSATEQHMLAEARVTARIGAPARVHGFAVLLRLGDFGASGRCSLDPSAGQSSRLQIGCKIDPQLAAQRSIPPTNRWERRRNGSHTYRARHCRHPRQNQGPLDARFQGGGQIERQIGTHTRHRSLGHNERQQHSDIERCASPRCK